MKTLKTLKQELLAQAVVQAAYEMQKAEFRMMRELIAIRLRKGG